ncbi:MAG TPA: sigma-70 family RNA polymerase sigma factor [Kofleriaceae bacterium]|nr:sigma-70 family RNA polymerase sigma factor [Kofleriaceae bacterium]
MGPADAKTDAPDDVRERPSAGRAADPDSDVIGLVANGDMTGALRRLMQRHGTSVFRYCREALRDTELAEDVQQQVFIGAFHDLPKFSGRSTVRTWLFAIARHRVLDAAKSRRRARSHVDSEDAAQLPDPQPPPGERLDEVRLREALVACLQKLPPHVITAVLLRFQQGFTFEEMADVCHEKPGTLQAQVARALPSLRTCIETRTGGKL